jgi:hypothetical protein
MASREIVKVSEYFHSFSSFLVLSEYNRAKEVTERVEEGLALARLIRHGADRDLVQAKKTRRSDWQAGDIHRELECFVAILSLGCRSSLNSSG